MSETRAFLGGMQDNTKVSSHKYRSKIAVYKEDNDLIQKRKMFLLMSRPEEVLVLDGVLQVGLKDV